MSGPVGEGAGNAAPRSGPIPRRTVVARRDPLIYLTPLALAFPPLLAYGGHALGWPGAWLSTRVALVMCIALFGFLRLIRNDFSYHQIPGLGFVTPYLFLVMTSVVWAVLGPYNAEAPAIANELLTWVILVTVVCGIGGTERQEGDVRTASRVLVAVALVQVVYSGLQGLVMVGADRFVPAPVVELTRYARNDLSFGSMRLHGTLPNLGPNFFGAFLLVPTVLAFSRAFSQGGVARLGWILAGLSFTTVIAATYSRGALFAVAIALLMIPVWRRSWRGFLCMICGIVMAALIILQTPVGRHVTELYKAGQLDPSGAGRMYLWGAIVKSAAEHPFGLGFNGWPRAARSSMDVGLGDLPSTFGGQHPAENQWMRELADRGSLGVLALLLLLGGIVRLTFRATEGTRSAGYVRDFLVATGASTVGWAFVFLTGDHLMYENVAGIFWYTTALALAANRDAVMRTAERDRGRFLSDKSGATSLKRV